MPGTSQKTIQVLHVDDEPDFADLVATFLQRESDRFEVETATSADAGMAALADRPPDCIVSDYDMPGKDGIEFLETIRDDYPDLPFILFTGKGSEEVASDAISAGATDYLQKGTGTDQYTVLANRIQNAVGHSRSERRAEEHKRITEVIRDLNRALVYATSVDEIEHDVCTILSDAEPYVTACIAGVNTDTMRIEPRTWAGDAAGYFEALDMSVSEGSPGRHAPGGRAFHERDIAISQNILDDPRYEQWRDAAVERGFRSLAVVPMEYDDDLYGLLAVFADRRYAFDEEEQELLAELGDDIAHAMHAQDVQTDLRSRNRAINEAPVGITITDPDQADNPMVYVNDEFLAVTGYRRDESLGENHRILQGPETADEPVAAMREAIDAEERVTVELRNYRKDGGLFWNRVSIAPVYDDGKLTNYIGFQEDITDRKEYERQLRRNERRFEALFNDPNLLVGLLTPDGTLLDANSTAMEYIDADREDVIDEPFWTTPWWSAEIQPAIREKIEQAATGQYVDYEADLTRPNGDQYSVTGVIRPVVTDSGEVDSLIVSARDVTDRVSHERSLDAILEHTTVPMFLKDRDGEYILVNQGFKRLFDLDDTEVRGRTDADLFQPEMASEVQKNDTRVLETGEPVETEERIIVNNEERIYLSSKTPVYDIGTESDPDDPVAIFGIASDITERKAREQEITRLNRLHQTILSNIRETVLVTDDDGRFTYICPNVHFIFGYEVSEVDAFETVQALFGERLIEPDELETAGEVTNVETTITDKSGDSRTVLVTVRQVDIGEGSRLYSVRDVTDRKHRKEKLERQNDRLEEFASVVSHDLRSPLRMADGRLDLIREECESDHIDDVAQALDRMDALIENLLTLAREGETVGAVEPVVLAELTEACWQHIAAPDAQIVTTVDRTINADRSRLQQLLENLLRNAVEHGGENVTVTIGEVETGFYVEDDGPGIPETDRDSVFRAGYSTSSEGTGFGLRIVRQVADAHGWEVAVTESGQGGARFEITGVEFTDP